MAQPVAFQLTEASFEVLERLSDRKGIGGHGNSNHNSFQYFAGAFHFLEAQ